MPAGSLASGDCGVAAQARLHLRGSFTPYRGQRCAREPPGRAIFVRARNGLVLGQFGAQQLGSFDEEGISIAMRHHGTSGDLGNCPLPPEPKARLLIHRKT